MPVGIILHISIIHLCQQLRIFFFLTVLYWQFLPPLGFVFLPQEIQLLVLFCRLFGLQLSPCSSEGVLTISSITNFTKVCRCTTLYQRCHSFAVHYIVNVRLYVRRNTCTISFIKYICIWKWPLTCIYLLSDCCISCRGAVLWHVEGLYTCEGHYWCESVLNCLKVSSSELWSSLQHIQRH